jgi:ribosomal protein L44E
VMAKNGGKSPYGEVDKIVQAYNANGYKAVTKKNLYYRLSKLKSGKNEGDSQMLGATIVTSTQTEGVLSDLTEERILSDVSNVQQDDNNINRNSINIGGRRKGSMKQERKDKNVKLAQVISTCATLYQAEVFQAKKLGFTNVPKGTLKKF